MVARWANSGLVASGGIFERWAIVLGAGGGPFDGGMPIVPCCAT